MPVAGLVVGVRMTRVFMAMSMSRMVAMGMTGMSVAAATVVTSIITIVTVGTAVVTAGTVVRG